MSTQRLLILLLALLALAGIASTCAQDLHKAPWPSEVFRAKPQQNTAGKFDYYTMVMSWSPTHCVTATSSNARAWMACARASYATGCGRSTRRVFQRRARSGASRSSLNR